MKDLRIFLFLFFYYYQCGYGGEDGGHPIVEGEFNNNNEEANEKCLPCHEMQMNFRGEPKCIAMPNCCADHSFRQNCIVDPCFYYKKACPRAHRCIPQSCSPFGCKSLYYDSKLNLIHPSDCHRYVFQRPRNPPSLLPYSSLKKPLAPEPNEKPPKIDIPSRLLHTSPNQIKYRENGKSKGKQQIWPTFFDYKGYEKPGACPTHQKYLIQICTQECSKDSECQGRKKCCWNGCTHRCINPMQKDDANFLNYPISGHWRRL